MKVTYAETIRWAIRHLETIHAEYAEKAAQAQAAGSSEMETYLIGEANRIAETMDTLAQLHRIETGVDPQ